MGERGVDSCGSGQGQVDLTKDLLVPQGLCSMTLLSWLV